MSRFQSLLGKHRNIVFREEMIFFMKTQLPLANISLFPSTHGPGFCYHEIEEHFFLLNKAKFGQG